MMTAPKRFRYMGQQQTYMECFTPPMALCLNHMLCVGREQVTSDWALQHRSVRLLVVVLMNGWGRRANLYRS